MRIVIEVTFSGENGDKVTQMITFWYKLIVDFSGQQNAQNGNFDWICFFLAYQIISRGESKKNEILITWWKDQFWILI